MGRAERATGRLVSGEADAFDAMNSLPDGLAVPAWPVMQLGNFWVCVGGSAAVYAIWRRPAPAVAVGTSTLGAWALAKVVKGVVARERPSHFFDEVRIRQRGLSGDGFVSGHVCVSFALATALTPWVPRPVALGGFTLAATAGAARSTSAPTSPSTSWAAPPSASGAAWPWVRSWACLGSGRPARPRVWPCLRSSCTGTPSTPICGRRC